MTTETLNLTRIVESLRQQLPELQQTYQITELGIFGSYVRGQQHSDSDLDMLISFQEPPSLLGFLRLENELSDQLGIKVDLVMRDTLKPTISSYILDEVIFV